MIVEFTGISGSGKTVLSNHVISELINRGISLKPVHADHFNLLGLPVFGQVKNITFQHVLLDLLSLFQLRRLSRSEWRFLGFCWRMLMAYGESIWVRINYFRNIVRRVGTDQWLRQRTGLNQLAIVDEGTVHNIHPALVHLGAAPNLADIELFASLAPLPDLIVHVRVPLNAAIARTIARPDPPINTENEARLTEFITRAHQVFEDLFELEIIRVKTLIVEMTEGEACLSRASDQIISHLMNDFSSEQPLVSQE